MSYSDYMFNSMSRIGNDECDLSQRVIQDQKFSNYMLTNYYPSCPMTNAINFATNQPGILYNGSKQVGINGCNVDYSSKLTITDLTKPKCKISLYQRPFLTVPYLGRGVCNPELESQLQQSEMVSNRKSVNNDYDRPYNDIANYPMLPHLRSTINNPANLVEGAAADGWIRGGLPSRDLIRDKEYASQKKY